MKNLIKFLSIAISAILIIGGGNNYSFASETIFKANYFGNPDGTKELNLDIYIEYSYLIPRSDQGELFKKVYKNWTDKFPQWKVNLSITKRSQERSAKLLEQLKASNAPDCGTVDSFRIPIFTEYLQPIEPYFSKGELDNLFPNFRKIATDKNGHLLYWWYSTDIRVIYYYKDLLEVKSNATWDEFRKALLEAKKKHPDLIPLYVSAQRREGTSSDWYAYFWQQGGKLIADDGKPVYGDKKNLPKMIKALNFYKDMVKDKLIPKSVLSLDDIGTLVGNRKIIAWQNGSWEVARIPGYLKSLGNEKYFSKLKIIQQPSYNGKDYATTTGGWTFVIFTKDKEKAKACAGFIKHVFAGPINKINGDQPTIYSSYKQGMFAKPIYNRFKEIAINSGHARPAKITYPEISIELQRIISRIISGEDFDIKEAIENSYKKSLRSYKRLARRKKS